MTYGHRIGGKVMWKFLGDRFTTGNAAMGVRRYVVTGVAGIVATAFTWLKGHIPEEWPVGWLLNTPLWAILVMTVIVFVSWFVLDYATVLRKQIEPKVTISFPRNGSIIETPQFYEIMKRVEESGVFYSGMEKAQRSAIYIRGRIDSQSAIAIKECNVFLTEVQREVSPGNFKSTDFLDAIPLSWASSEHQYSVSVPSGVPRFFDIVCINETDNLLEFTSVRPLRLLNLFREAGTYRLKITAVADGAHTHVIYDLTKKENWNEISGQKIS